MEKDKNDADRSSFWPWFFCARRQLYHPRNVFLSVVQYCFLYGYFQPCSVFYTFTDVLAVQQFQLFSCTVITCCNLLRGCLIVLWQPLRYYNNIISCFLHLFNALGYLYVWVPSRYYTRLGGTKLRFRCTNTSVCGEYQTERLVFCCFLSCFWTS